VDLHLTAQASDWVLRWADQVKPQGRVLDVAGGWGRHAALFSARGHQVCLLDRDAAALAHVRQHWPQVNCIEADIENGPWHLDSARFDAVIVTNYLWRALWPQILSAIKPGGCLIYETFAAGNERFGKPSNPAFLLRRGELLERCAGMHILAYEDLELSQPARCVQRIVAVR
jgi:SAM-dependent methyltransferase